MGHRHLGVYSHEGPPQAYGWARQAAVLQIQRYELLEPQIQIHCSKKQYSQKETI